MLCLLSLLESKTQVKSSKCSVVFAVIVGEQDTKKSGKCSIGKVRLGEKNGKRRYVFVD